MNHGKLHYSTNYLVDVHATFRSTAMAAPSTDPSIKASSKHIVPLSARDNVFETVELLDDILGHVLAEREEYDGKILR